jgi:hypothetical protein
MKFKNIKYPIFSTITISWSLLGFMRGINSYDYSYKKYNGILVNQTSYLYASKICNGFVGSFLYITPIVNFYMIIKEIHRLEVNIRNLEYEKKTDYYNLLI